MRTEEVDRTIENLNKHQRTMPVTLRADAEISRFFTSLDLLPPGLVQVHRWDPNFSADMAAESRRIIVARFKAYRLGRQT